MEEKLKDLKDILAKVNDIGNAAAVLDWDQQVFMPEDGDEERGEQLSTLQEIGHNLFVSDKVGQLLADLQPLAASQAADSETASLIRVTQRAYDKETKIPVDLLVKLTQATTVAHNAWVKARANNDFASFQPHLEKIIDLIRQKAECFRPFDHIYDALLDDYEPGMKAADVKAIFSELRPKQVALIKSIGESEQVDASFLKADFDEDKQWAFGIEVISAFGMDWKRSRQDSTAHPFTTTFGQKDVRITTRIIKDLPTSGLFSTMHEAGHALYELGFDPSLRRTPLSNASSMAFHESQSRMWENLVGRSLPFWSHFYPKLVAAFPQQLGNIRLETFYKAINRVKPSLIRTEADEATYNLHIMLRFELELELIEGTLKVSDLPEAWNEHMREYLGITPPSDSDGVLQDVHWSAGLFGYFPTYAIGNLISVQLWEKLHEDLPDIDDKTSRGDFKDLLNWLRLNVHQHGAKYEPQDLIQRITGSKIDAKPYVAYLESKYKGVYNF